MIDLILSGLFVLVLGSYGYAYRVSRRIDEVMSNHLHDITKRLDRLEDKVGPWLP